MSNSSRNYKPAFVRICVVLVSIIVAVALANHSGIFLNVHDSGTIT